MVGLPFPNELYLFEFPFTNKIYVIDMYVLINLTYILKINFLWDFTGLI